LIPIYTKDETEKKTNRFKIPNRPKGERENNTNSSSFNGRIPNGSEGFFNVNNTIKAVWFFGY
jgi:hypothetical protein